MNRSIIVAAALSVLLPGAAFAQDQSRDQHGAEQNRPQEGHPPAGHPQPARPMQHAQPARREPMQHAAPAERRAPMRAAPVMGREGPEVRPLPPRGNQFWHRGEYHNRIAGPAFAFPPGQRYRQWTIGARAPTWLVDPRYYYPGWAALGLQAPPPGYSWVRYGPDLLLVNLSTDEVEDVIYGVFQ